MRATSLFPLAARSWSAAGTVLLAIGAALLPLVWEVAAAGVCSAAGSSPEDLRSVATAKLGFALLLAAVLGFGGGWRRAGFAGRLAVGAWWLAWPLWVAAAVSAAQVDTLPSPGRAAGWLLTALAIGFGEEGIYRGVVLARLRPLGARTAVTGSALLFGAAHLIGLFAPLDPRMILAQAALASGLGLCLGAIRVLSGSIWPCLAAHAILDFSGLLAADGIGEALEFSEGALVYWLSSAVVSSVWGILLLRRLSVPTSAQHRVGGEDCQ